MRNSRQKKYTKNILDIITLQNLKIIILVCFILSLICEFLPSILDICKLFKYNSFIVFLQPHKDFFTNIVLGCLGSAIISYIILLIPQKAKIQEERNEISIYLKKVISDFFVLYAYLDGIMYSKSFENSKLLENTIRVEKNNLYLHINNLLKYYENTNYININRTKEVIEICQNKLLVALNEIDIFLDIHTKLRMTDDDLIYSIDTFNEIYKLLFDNLEKNYNLKNVYEIFSQIMPIEIAITRDMDKIEEGILNYIDIKKSGLLHIYYVNEIAKVYQKHAYDNLKS